MRFAVYLMDWAKLGRDRRYDVMNGWTGPCLEAFKEGLYESYHLEAKDHNEVYEILNINLPADYRLRPMSTGDMVEDENGTKYLCKALGWQMIPSGSKEGKLI